MTGQVPLAYIVLLFNRIQQVKRELVLARGTTG
jgi:hypothetical protein